MDQIASHVVIGLFAGAFAMLGAATAPSPRPREALPCILLAAACGAMFGLTLVYAAGGPRLYGTLSRPPW